MIVPTFFIIGAPKCGTTALSSYLSEHPDVLFSEPKEPHYFHTDFDERHRVTRTPEEYNACFRRQPGTSPRAIGEGTVWYLYSGEAVPNILRLNPDARFIVMLRNPVDLVYSLHSQLLYSGNEDIVDFDAAWRAQDERRRGDSLPSLCPDKKLLLYGDVAALGSQLARLFDTVERDRVHTVLFDDFAGNTRAAYRGVLEFLELPNDARTSFEIRNSNRMVIHLGLARLAHRLNVIKRRLGFRASFGVWRVISPWLSRRAPRPPMSQLLREELLEYFRAEVTRLSMLLDRDLSSWNQ